MPYAIGVDVGGTKVAAVVIDQNFHILNRVELKSDTSHSEKMFAQVTKSINKVLEKSEISFRDIRGMGIGVPGKVDIKNGIAIYQNNLPWDNFNIVDRLQEYYKLKNIYMDNDVHVATLAEWKASNLKEEDTLVYITISTGISCAIIHRGNFIRGAGFAGEIGFSYVTDQFFSDPLNRLESVASGPAIESKAQKIFNDQYIATKDVFKKYSHGCTKASEIIHGISRSLAQSVYSIICLLDPHKIIFGGGVINNNPYLLDLIKSYLGRYLISEQERSLQHMHVSHFKENAGVIGAGILGLNKLGVS